jgi:hypothetical protein
MMISKERRIDRVYYRITDTISDKTVCFHCFNTAWMSRKSEQPGTLFFPPKRFEEARSRNESHLSIAVFHHPLNWFTPSTVENNRKEFQNLLDHIASLQITGHEGENELRKTEDIDIKASQALCISGDDLQDRKNQNKSGFQTLLINLNSNEARLRRYRWKDGIYRQYSEITQTLTRKANMTFQLNEKFLGKLNEMAIPFNLGDKQLKLFDLYIFPDLEHLTSKSDDAIDDFVDSKRLLSESHFEHCILEGEGQVGKSSLLNMLFLRFYDKGFYPILLRGKDIASDDFDKTMQNAFHSQYREDSSYGDYEKFKQIDKGRKVLLIDDLHSIKWHGHGKPDGIKSLLDLFSRTFVTLDTAYNIIREIRSEFKDFHSFSIKPLGFKKSNDLVQRYLLLRDPSFSQSRQVFLEKTKDMFDDLRQILRDKLIPSHPIFVLSIIQALENTPLKLDETSYGYCYQTLIHLAFMRAGIPNDDFDSYLNILTELAFDMFMNKTDSISESEFESFYTDYRTRFVAPSLQAAANNLLSSMILKNDSGYFSFGYKYILYFLAAKKIAEMIETTEGKGIVNDLYANLHQSKNAHILVLVTHHTRNYSIIQDSVFSLLLPFESAPPITLEKRCDYYKLLEEVTEEVKQEVIESRDPSEERRKQLLAQDASDRRKDQNSAEDSESGMREFDIPFIQAYRSMCPSGKPV